MPWLQVETANGHSDPATVEAVLEELGAAAVWLRDAGDEPLLEPAPGETPVWRETVVAALFPAELNKASLAEALESAVPGTRFRFSTVTDRDWQAEFQQALKPLDFEGKLRVVPGNSPADGPGAVVRLTPGLAFGTGEHPTTALCLRWLTRQNLRGSRVLDYGCGSGLLAIAALKLGAARATAVDRDPQALDATRDNAEHNNCLGCLEIAKPDAVRANAQYDALVANILSGTLIELAPVLRDVLRSGAALALTGILAHQADDVALAWSGWADLAVTDQDGEWVLLSGFKRGK